MPPPLLKRPIRGRLGRFLASLRPPSRVGSLPVQTGFPTSLADLIVKNHDRLLLNKPKRRRPTPTTTTPSPPTPPVAAAVEPPPPQQLREQSVVEDKVGVAFRLRPELLAVGAAVALVMVLIWSRWLVAALTVASLSLLWIESVRSNSTTSSSSRRPPPRTPAAAELPDLRGRGAVSPIREVESAAEATPRSSCSAVSVSSLWTDDKRSQLDGGGAGESTTNSTKRKEKRRWLRKLLAKKKKPPPPPPPPPPSKEKDSSHGEVTPPDAGEISGNADAVGEEAIAEQQQQPSPPEAAAADGRRGGALPFAAFAAVVLVGLVGGKLPAVALTVLFTVFFSSVERRDQKFSSSDELI